MSDQDIHYKASRSAPGWIKQIVPERGRADATEPLSLWVGEDDIDRAFALVAHGDGAACAMAQAGSRLGAKEVYFYRTQAWVDFGSGPILRFQIPTDMLRNVIEPFDRRDREAVKPGVYHLKPSRPSQALGVKRKRNASQGPRQPRKRANASNQPRMERVVMGAQR